MSIPYKYRDDFLIDSEQQGPSLLFEQLKEITYEMKRNIGNKQPQNTALVILFPASEESSMVHSFLQTHR